MKAKPTVFYRSVLSFLWIMGLPLGLYAGSSSENGSQAKTALSALSLSNAQAQSLPRWDLSDLFLNMEDPHIQKVLHTIKKESVDFQKKYKGKVAHLSAENLHTSIQAYEKIYEKASKIAAYAQLLALADQNNPAKLAFKQTIVETIESAQKDVLFFPLELSQIKEAQVEKLFKESKPLGQYEHWIRKGLKTRKHLLTQELEELSLDLSSPSQEAWITLAQTILSKVKVTINKIEYNLSSALDLSVNSLDPQVRQESYLAVQKAFQEQAETFTQIYNAFLKSHLVNDHWRKFKNPSEARHLSNDIDPEDVTALVEATKSRYRQIIQRYYQMKARWLSKKRLEIWDRNAPLPWEQCAPLSYQEAQRVVFGAYQSFSPQMGMLAQKFFQNPWIDAPIMDGKYLGAFNYAIPNHHPFILINYKGNQEGVMTLAHEVGHGIHGLLSLSVGALQYHSSVTLAETASIFGEILTFKSLLARTQEARQRLTLLAKFAESMINTTLRQISFHEFELKIHTARAKGPLRTQDIQTLWMDTQKEIFGETVHLRQDYENAWIGVPHFLNPFYVYAYAFGQCLVNSLYQVYTEHPEGFEEKYLAILSAGGSKPYKDLLKPLGLNPKDKAFWDKGLSFIENVIDEIEELDRGMRSLPGPLKKEKKP